MVIFLTISLVQDFTKVLLLCMFYSGQLCCYLTYILIDFWQLPVHDFYSPPNTFPAFYPLIYFLGALILFIQYWMDKFLLLVSAKFLCNLLCLYPFIPSFHSTLTVQSEQRSWQKAPLINPNTARFSRTYFTTAALVMGAFSSAYAYARSPYTNLCECYDENPCNETNSRSFDNVQLLNGALLDAVQTSEQEYFFCNQRDIDFPPVPINQGSVKWMTQSQETLSRIYGWTSLILLIVYIVVVLGQSLIRSTFSFWTGMYKVNAMSFFGPFIFFPNFWNLAIVSPLLCSSREEMISAKTLAVVLVLNHSLTFHRWVKCFILSKPCWEIIFYI